MPNYMDNHGVVKLVDFCTYPSGTRGLTRLPISPSARRFFAAAAATVFGLLTSGGTIPAIDLRQNNTV